MRLGWPAEAAAGVVPRMDWAARHTPAAYLRQQQNYRENNWCR